MTARWVMATGASAVLWPAASGIGLPPYTP
jgi:hypothetical protein